MKKTLRPFFSIVIPALNEVKFIPKLLSDLTKQTYTDFEVIVVDGASEDGTATAVAKFSKKLPLKCISTPKRNVSHQRNLGGDAARGQWIVFMDADNRIEPHFLIGIAYQLQKDPSIDAFTGLLHLPSSARFDQLMEYSMNVWLEFSLSVGKPQAAGALIGCKRDIFATFKFDEAQLIFEDIKFVEDIYKSGYSFVIIREPRISFSLRRIKKEGTFKMLRNYSLNITRYLSQGDFSEPYVSKKYPMLGGGYYTNAAAASSEQAALEGFFKRFENTLKTASHKQLEQARGILQRLRDI